jgi:hypothetical protein
MTLTRFRISGETALSSETRLLESGLFAFRRRFSFVLERGDRRLDDRSRRLDGHR